MIVPGRYGGARRPSRAGDSARRRLGCEPRDFNEAGRPPYTRAGLAWRRPRHHGRTAARTIGRRRRFAIRIIQGLVAGIGFIGGGAILHGRGVRSVHGLTTAASIWIASGTGVAVGVGLWRAALTAVILSLIVLTIGRRLDNALHKISGANPDDN